MKRFLIILLSLIFIPSAFSQQKASDQGAQAGSFIPSGVVMPYAGATAPSGWAFAYGQEVSQTSATYKNLYAAISTTYCTTEHGGTCTGGNFRLPDLRGRSIHGKDNMGGTAASRITTAATIDGTVLGKSGGGQTNTLAAGNIPQVSTSYTPTGTITGDGSHGHSMGSYIAQSSTNSIVAVGAGAAGGTVTGSVTTASSIPSTSSGHSHGLSGNAATITVGNASPSVVNNLAPTTIMNYIIKL